MSKRMTFEQFELHCGSPVICGYAIFDGERQATTHQELAALVARRIRLDESDCSLAGLTNWLMARQAHERTSLFDCAQQDIEHASAVVLMGELCDPDAYVASIPEDATMQMMPPLDIVRRLVEAERQAQD